MRCPKCGNPMMLDDYDEDYGKNNLKDFITRRKSWMICDNCKIGVIREEFFSYLDEYGAEIIIKEDVEQ